MLTNEVFRIISWNVQAGTIEEKCHYLEKYRPDVVILQEVARPDITTSKCVWMGDNPRKGLAISTSSEYRIEPYPIRSDAPKYFLPVFIKGPHSFNLMAVWTHKRYNYVESLKDVLTLYRDFLKNPFTIVAGDFNSNSIWDHLHRKYSHSMMVDDLYHEFNLVSCYHTKNGLNHGEEKDPTIFWLRNKDKRYHIDYCFVPKQSTIERVAIGNYDEWKDLSDHRPLMVDLALNASC